jgi:malonyl-ACP decarboxylase
MVAVLLQMEEGKLHPSRNLENPIDVSVKWVKDRAFPHQIQNAINLSMGFGGINTAICLQRYY